MWAGCSTPRSSAHTHTHMCCAGTPRANKAVSREKPEGSEVSAPNRTVLQQHVEFYDRCGSACLLPACLRAQPPHPRCTVRHQWRLRQLAARHACALGALTREVPVALCCAVLCCAWRWQERAGEGAARCRIRCQSSRWPAAALPHRTHAFMAFGTM
jgi:hypothetical protein